MPSPAVHQLEQIARLSWPAEDEAFLQSDWCCRANGGYSKRANSAWVDVAAEQSWETIVATTEAWYAKRQQQSVIKLTDWQPRSLDNYLHDRGYKVLDPSTVMVKSLVSEGIYKPIQDGLYIGETDDCWQQDYRRLADLPADKFVPFMTQLTLMPERIAITAYSSGLALATGLGIIVDGFLGLCDIVTAVPHRRQGHAERVVASLLHEGIQRGCHTAWLQVFNHNVVASRLYQKLGFQPAYGYHYRVRD